MSVVLITEFLGRDGQPAVAGVTDAEGQLLFSYVGQSALIECLEWVLDREAELELDAPLVAVEVVDQMISIKALGPISTASVTLDRREARQLALMVLEANQALTENGIHR